MATSDTLHFTHAHTELDNGSLAFECSQDVDAWPWLALAPFDPIVVQTINYWAPVETGATRGTFDRTKWSALTEAEWICGDLGAGHAVRGISEPIDKENSMRYGIEFFDSNDARVYTMRGTGVVFQNRDFDSWRTQAKKKIAGLQKPGSFQYAPYELVGADNQDACFISPLHENDTISVQSLITKNKGFIPDHPYISGSGDHVNSTHLAVVGMQFTHLLNGGRALYCTGGKMQFKRFVELDHPFDIIMIADRRSENTVELSMHQAGHLCANMAITYEFI